MSIVRGLKRVLTLIRRQSAEASPSEHHNEWDHARQHACRHEETRNLLLSTVKKIAKLMR